VGAPVAGIDQFDVAQESLVAADQTALDQGNGKLHRAGKVGNPAASCNCRSGLTRHGSSAGCRLRTRPLQNRGGGGNLLARMQEANPFMKPALPLAALLVAALAGCSSISWFGQPEPRPVP